MTILLAGACVAPFIIWWLWRRSERIVYQGEALAVLQSKYIGRTGENAFISVVLPDGRWLLAEIPVARATRLPDVAENDTTVPPLPVTVEVKSRPLGSPWVERVTWDSGSSETAHQRGDSLAVAVLYLVAGVAALTSQILLLSEVLLVVSGFVTGAELVKAETRAAPGQLMALAIMSGLLALGTFAFFLEFTVFTVFPGLTVAFGLGQVLGMLQKGLRRR